MNTTVMTLVKVAGIYALALVLWAGIFAAVIAAVVYLTEIDLKALPDPKVIVASSSRWLLFLYGAAAFIVVSVFFMVPAVVGGAFYHRFEPARPDGETRLTLYMVVALAGFLLSLPPAVAVSIPLLRQLFDADLKLYEICFFLAFLALDYYVFLIFGAAGLAIGMHAWDHGAAPSRKS